MGNTQILMSRYDFRLSEQKIHPKAHIKRNLEGAITRFYNYLDMSPAQKNAALDQLLQIGFCPPCGDLKDRNTIQRAMKAIREEMDKSCPGTLPQYLFVFREDRLIGYMFLIAERENACKVFPWWAVDNSDELPREISVQLLELGAELSAKCNAPILSSRLKRRLAAKNGIVRDN